VEFNLNAGETMHIDRLPRCLRRSVDYDIQFVGGIKTALLAARDCSSRDDGPAA